MKRALPYKFRWVILSEMKSKFVLFAALISLSVSVEADPKLKPIFTGKDLSGWAVPKGNDKAGWYSVEKGVLKIKNGPDKKGSILWTKKKFRNFVMEFDWVVLL